MLFFTFLRTLDHILISTGVILYVVLKQQNIKLSAGKSKSVLDVFFLDMYLLLSLG